ncbi:hypothetical protein [Campylobacter sp. LR291e]|uniref:hypothetical protein n=1 Tax=Campylobacter sp. LR291e TaxID=2593546 RepID=UPI003988EC24
MGYSHIQGLYPYDSNLWNEKRYIYFLTTFKKAAFSRFDYANKFNRKIAKEMFVTFPTNKDKQIAFDFIEKFIRTIQKESIKEVVLYTERKIKAYERVINN